MDDRLALLGAGAAKALGEVPTLRNPERTRWDKVLNDARVAAKTIGDCKANGYPAVEVAVIFVGGNAVITYSKSPTKKNHYSWRLQVIPLAWFYEGDTSKVYGEKFLAGLKANGIKKFIAYEVDVNLCRERYADHFDFISKYLGAKDDFRVLDYNGYHIFDTFSFEEMKETFKVTF